jgi:hypothetical protein
MMKFMSKILLTVAAVVFLSAGPAHAQANQSATQTVTVNMAFDTPVSITGTPTIQMGTVQAGVAETYTISTAGLVTAAGNSTRILYGSKSAANLTIIGSLTQAISINANNYNANGNVTPSAATCNYNSTGSAGCSTLTTVAAPGAGKTLLVGVTAAASSAPSAGATASPTFDIVVTYN